MADPAGELTAKDLWRTWKHVAGTERITEEPADDRPLRSLLNIWRRYSDGLWRSDRNPSGDGVPFALLSRTLRLRNLSGENPGQDADSG